MSPLPLPVRVAAGLVATALEQVRKFPEQLSDIPVTAASRAVQAGMRMQQRVTALAIKGDQLFALFQPVEDTPPWARFDEDEDEDDDAQPEPRSSSAAADANGLERTGSGRAAERSGLAAVVPGPGAERRGEIDEATVARGMSPAYPVAVSAGTSDISGTADTSDESDTSDAPGAAQGGGSSRKAGKPGTPAALPGYDQLTLAQLRGRLRGLSLPQLEELLEHEQTQQDRAAFVTMLSNRIITVRSR